MSQALTRQWLRQNISIYPAKDRVYADVDTTLGTAPNLRPKTDIYTYDDGRTQLLLCVHGLLPIQYRQSTYHIPIMVWLPRDYPRDPPIAYVVPTSDMLVKPSKHMDVSGRANIEYLQNWARKSEGCSLLALVQAMQAEFSREPPLYSKPKQQQQPPVPQTNASSPQPGSRPDPNLSTRPPAIPPKPSASASPPLAQPALPSTRSPVPVQPPSLPHLNGAVPGSPRHHQTPALPPKPPSVLPTTTTTTTTAAANAPQPPPPHSPPRLPVHHHPQYSQSSIHVASPIQWSAPPPAPASLPPAPVPNPEHRWSVPPPIPASPPSLPIHALAPAYTAPPAPLPPPIAPAPGPAHPPPLNLLDADEENAPAALSLSSPPPTQPAPAPPRPPNPELLWLHEQARAKLAAELASLAQATALDAERLRAHQRDLLAGEPAIRDESARLGAVHDVCAGVVARLRDAVARASERVEDLKRKGEPPVDELVCSTSIVHNQLVDLVAEDNAIEDTVYHLHRALNAGRIDLDRFLRTARVLAEEQFMKRALIEKIQTALPPDPVGGW